MNKEHTNKKRAIFLAKNDIVSIVYESIQLEHIDYDYHDVMMLSEGITVGRHKLSDLTIVINQLTVWRRVFKYVEQGKFILSIKLVLELHKIAGYQEALEWGKFREGNAYIAGTEYMPPKHTELLLAWTQMICKFIKIQDKRKAAIFIFLEMARNQFFYDVNKRMGRIVMNGLLLSEGYPIINLLSENEEEFNKLMLEFYVSGDHKAMTKFMLKQ